MAGYIMVEFMSLGYDDLGPIPAETSDLTFLSSEWFIFKLEIVFLPHDFMKIK